MKRVLVAGATGYLGRYVGCFCPTPRKGIFQNIKIYLSYHR